MGSFRRTLTGRTGRVFRFRDLVYWAYEGLIAMEDERNGDYLVIFPDDLMNRRAALKAMLKTISPSKGTAFEKDLYRDTKNVIDEMKQCVKEAKDMGDPSDPSVQAFYRRHRPGKKSTISLSAGTNKNGYPTLSILPRGKFTGRTAKPDGIALPTPEHRIRRRPRRKSRAGIILP